MLGSKQITKAANVFIFLILVIISWSFKSSYFSYALILFVLFLVMDGIYSVQNNRTFYPKRTRLFYVMTAGIFVFYLASNLTSILHWNRLDLIKSLDYTWLCFPFFLTWWILSKYDAEKGLRWGILAGAAIACVIGIYQWYLQPGIRVQSSYANPNHFGTMIDITIPFIAYFMLSCKNIIYRIIASVVLLGQVFCLFATSSRGALIGLIGALILSTLLSGLIAKRGSQFQLRKSVVALALGLVILGGFGAYYMEHGRAESHLGGERMFMIEASIDMWKDHPFIGVGAAHWQENYYGAYHPEGASEKGLTMPHNMPLYFLSTGGILGGIGFIAFYVLSFMGLYLVLREQESFLFSICALIPFFAFLIQGLVDTTIINKIPARMYFALMGYLTALSINYNKKASNKK